MKHFTISILITVFLFITFSPLHGATLSIDLEKLENALQEKLQEQVLAAIEKIQEHKQAFEKDVQDKALKGAYAKIEKAISTLGLPTEIPDSVDRTQLLETMQVDKKKTQGTIRFALPIRIGYMHPSAQITNLNKHIMEI